MRQKEKKMRNVDDCCRGCHPPKRHPGCHSPACPDWVKHEEKKQERYAIREIAFRGIPDRLVRVDGKPTRKTLLHKTGRK